MRIPLIPEDKANHVVYGSAIGAAVLAVQVVLPAHPVPPPVVAISLVAAAGAIKELLDRRNPAHTADLMDFVATVAGGLLVCVPAFLA